MLAKIIHDFLNRYTQPTTIWLAYSGGVDSHALLHACVAEKNNFPHLIFKAVHVNHQLSSAANTWQQHAAIICDELNIALHAEKVTIQRQAGESLEDQARQARQKVFKRMMQPGDIIFTAHHQDDQAETVLLQLLRGAGVRGLRAMHAETPFGLGILARPLLSISRQAILTYAKQQQLKWVDDPSNESDVFSRNFLRGKVLPLLSERWPQAKTKLAHSAVHLQEAHELLEEIAIQDLRDIQFKPNQLDIKRLCQLSLPRLKNVLRHWIKQLGFLLPDAKVLNAIIQEAIHASVDANPLVTWGKAEIRRYQNYLYLLPILPELNSSLIISWDITKQLTLPADLGYLAAVPSAGGIKIRLEDQVEIRFRQGGEACYLPGRKGRHTLKKLLQEWHIPPWQRDRVPLLYINNELAMIVGYSVVQGFDTEQMGYEIRCDRYK